METDATDGCASSGTVVSLVELLAYSMILLVVEAICSTEIRMAWMLEGNLEKKLFQ